MRVDHDPGNPLDDACVELPLLGGGVVVCAGGAALAWRRWPELRPVLLSFAAVSALGLLAPLVIRSAGEVRAMIWLIPLFCLGLAAMLETLGLPFIMTARAKGLSERTVTWRHAWRNALFPVLTLFGLWLPILVTGSVFVESVFAWPGLGSLAAAAVSSRDYPLLVGASVLVASLVVAASLVTDVAYALLDPRVRLA
jgi:ABC-type microcin C transport system permease subunit YejE